MTETPMPWVKLETKYLDDPRFGRLPDSAKARYLELLMLAGRCDAGGYFYKSDRQMTEEEIAWALRIGLDQFKSDIEILKTGGLASINGHGLQLINFETEQGPTQAEKREQWRARQERHRNTHGLVTRDTSVTHVSKSQSQESDIELESKNKSQSVNELAQQTTDDDRIQTLTKIFKLCGVPQNYRNMILANPSITREDVLAELTRNYSKKGIGKGKVQQPSLITGMNLAKCEKPSAEWYEQLTWTRYLPEAMQIKLGLVIQSEDSEDENIVISDYTQVVKNPKWEKITDAMQHSNPELDTPTFHKHFDTTDLLSVADGLYTFSCNNQEDADWLTGRFEKMLCKILIGIENIPDPQVRFVARESK